MTREGRFRADLYFRLRIVHIVVPPLRERDGDVLLLAHHFVELLGARYGKRGLKLSTGVLNMLRNHRWPGNVRELRNVIEQAVLLAKREVIQPEELSLCAELAYPVDRRSESAGCQKCPDFPCEGMKLDELEREHLLRALRQTSWNVTRAATLLGISRDTLRYRIEKFSLAPST